MRTLPPLHGTDSALGPTLARGLMLLAALGSVGCATEPSSPEELEPRVVVAPSYIEITLTEWQEPGSTDIALYQGGSSVAFDLATDATTGTITITPQSPLDPTAPYDLQLSAGLSQKMVPHGPLWITPGDPDCDESAEWQVDDDEDGLPDCSEKAGTYYWGMPLNYWGAAPGQTDVFVEVRYLLDEPGSPRPWMRPWPQALDKVRDEFLAHGYVVHFDVGDLYEGTDYDGYEEGVDWSGEFDLNGDFHGFRFPQDGNIDWVTPEPNCNKGQIGQCSYDPSGWDVWTPNNFLTSYASQMMQGRDRSFYFVLFGYNADANNASGRTHHGGRNAIITLGQFVNSFTVETPAQGQPWNKPANEQEQRNKIINYQAAVLMHEMGHMFGFREGGDVQLSGKPNYLSSMSYVHMFPGLPHDDADLQQRHENYQSFTFPNTSPCPTVYLSQLAHGPLGDPAQFRIGYSEGDEDEQNPDTLTETSLTEADGIGTAPWGPSAPIDWNCDGDTTDVLANYNVTGTGWYPSMGTCGGSAVQSTDTLTDHDDWANLELYHRKHFLSGDWPNAGLPFECAFPQP